MIYRQSCRLLASDVDAYRRLRLSRLFTMMQEAAIAHTEALGMGREKTLDRGLLWIVTMQSAEIARMPEYDERIRLLSWPGETMHLFFPRHYRIEDETGAPLIRATALWMLVDQASRRMVFPERYGIEIAGEQHEGELPLPSAPARLPTSEERLFTVPYSYVDLNGHMNNTRYFDLMEDCLPAAAAGQRLRSVRTEYTSEARLGDTLRVRWGEQDGSWYLEGLLEKTCFRMALTYEQL